VEKERKKAEKQAKFDQKKAKAASATPAATSKSKEKKAKAEKKAEEGILPAYVEETPAGDKKSKLWDKYPQIMPCSLFP
jgi:valyl-tRNA synthetase